MQNPETFLTFALAPHIFAVRALCAREIVRAVAITPVGGAPGVVEGTINYRGSFVPVLDIRARFGLDPRDLHPDQHFVVVETAEGLVALRVDRVLDLVQVPLAAIDETDRSLDEAGAATGFSWIPDGLVVIHDLEHFLSPDERAWMQAEVWAGTRRSGGEAA